MKINIGTNKGNIVGVEINKKFKEIKCSDCFNIAVEHFKIRDLSIIGWCRNYKRK